MSGSTRVPVPLAVLAGAAILAGAVAFGALLAGGAGGGWRPMNGHEPAGHMERPAMVGGAVSDALQPGDAGFVPGTPDRPRVVYLQAGPGYAFYPSEVNVAGGETVTFVVTTMGPMVHEFMVGPTDAVAADREGTPEIEDIGTMETKTLTYTFDGLGPYAFACHAEEHYENGMTGTIAVVG
jgi:plastocyanin